MLNNYKIELSISLIFLLILLVYLINQPIEFQCDSALFYNYGSFFFSKYKYINLLPISVLIFTLYMYITKRKFSEFFYIDKQNDHKYIIDFKFFIITIIILTLMLFISHYSISDNPYQIADFRRPPVYPLFLFFSGIYMFDTLKILIFLQAILSFLIVLQIFNILNKLINSKKISFIITLFYMFTGLPFILVKFIIAEQLLFFFIISTINFLVSHYSNNKFFFLKLSFIFSILAWLTKWEGIIIFFTVIIYTILNLKRIEKPVLPKLISVSIIPLLILSIWISFRAISTGDFSKFWSVSKSNNEQLFYKFYSVIPSQLYNLKKTFNIKINDDEELHKNIIFGDRNDIKIIDKINGNFSNELFYQVEKYVSNYPESYEPYKIFLKDAVNQYDLNFYYELFGKFEGKPQELSENIFNQVSIYYFNYINTDFDKYLGRETKNNLYSESIKEAIRQKPLILFLFFYDFMITQGINIEKPFKGLMNSFTFLNNTVNYDGENVILKTSPKKLFTKLKQDRVFINAFNAGGCGKNNFSNNHFSEYEVSHENWNKIKSLSNFVYINDYFKSNLRIYLGIFIFFGCIFLIFTRNYKIFLPLIIIPYAYDFILVITVAPNIDTKYEVITFTIKFILLSLIITRLVKYLIYKINFKL